MKNNNLFSSDSYISQYIKNVLLKVELENSKIIELLNTKFNNEELKSIKDGSYTFNIEEFMFITQALNINTTELFIQLAKK